MHHGTTNWLLSLPFLPHTPGWEHVNGAVVVFLIISIFSGLVFFKIRNNLQANIIPAKKCTLVSVMDAFMEALFNVIAGTLGKSAAYKYFPFISSVFIFILVSNLLGLIPFGSSPSSNLNTTLALGLSSFIYYNVNGVREQGLFGYLKHFLCGLGPAGILIAVLEMFSHFVRPLSLSFRLFVNMYVDHTLLLSFQELFAWILPVPMLFFGVVVSLVQTFVFTILTAVYLQIAVEHEH